MRKNSTPIFLKMLSRPIRGGIAKGRSYARPLNIPIRERLRPYPIPWSSIRFPHVLYPIGESDTPFFEGLRRIPKSRSLRRKPIAAQWVDGKSSNLMSDRSWVWLRLYSDSLANNSLYIYIRASGRRIILPSILRIVKNEFCNMFCCDFFWAR